MGIALADTAAAYGADVELVLGPVNLLPSEKSVKVINVTTAASMAEECISRFAGCDIAILSAAVADFTPLTAGKVKIKKTGKALTLKLMPTIDIALELGRLKKRSQLLAGFALETANGIINATEKLKRKKLDMIVLNSLEDKGAGFGYDTTGLP